VVGGGMLALFVFALGVFLLPFAFPTPPPIVTRFQATRLFSPNEDGRRDLARVSVRMRERGTVTLEVRGVDGGLVRTLMTDRPAGPGWVRAAWGGDDDRGLPAPDGEYSVRLRARAGRKQFNTSRRIVVDRTPPPVPRVTAVSAGLGAVPDGVQCLVTAVPAAAGLVRFTAAGATEGEPLRRLGPRPAAAGQARRWAWDGLGRGGTPLSPGLRVVDVTVSEPSGNRIAVRRTCWIGGAVGRAVPAAPRAGGRVRVVLRRPDGTAFAPGTPVTLRLFRRAGTPGDDLIVLGPRVARAVRATAATAAMRLPETLRPGALWLQAQVPGGRALVALGDAP
jgi:hypothetical protein